MPKTIPAVSDDFDFDSNYESTTGFQPPAPQYTTEPNNSVNYNNQNYNNQNYDNTGYQNNSGYDNYNVQDQAFSGSGLNDMQMGGDDFQRGFNGGDISIQDLGNIELFDLIQMLIVYAFIIAGFLAAVFIFVGGISFILSGGDDEKIKKAVNTIRYSINGLIVTILSYTFITIVGKIFNLDLLNYNT